MASLSDLPIGRQLRDFLLAQYSHRPAQFAQRCLLEACLDPEADLRLMLGIPQPAAHRRALRDYWLHRAAEHLELPPRKSGPGRKQTDVDIVVAALRLAIHDFLTCRASRWRVHGCPENARELDRCLFMAASYGKLPETRQRLRAIMER